MNDTNKCTKCNEVKPQIDFVKSNTTKSGYRGCCKLCFNAYYAKRREEKYEQVREYEKKFHRARRLKYEYGITEEYYSNLISLQNNSCVICSTSFTITPAKIDHCHTSGIVRGLLCNTCNLGLGHFKDKKELLQNAINYLNQYDNAN